MTATATGTQEVRALCGRTLGPTAWITVTQEMVDLFADATGDHQWIHVDRERARSSPFGGTIAHGYLTLSMIPRFLPELIEVDGFSMGLNYGAEKIRFPAPVPVGSRVRAEACIDEVDDIPGGLQMRMTVTITLAEQAKPACVATIVLRRYV